jgi:hypothetical protein
MAKGKKFNKLIRFRRQAVKKGDKEKEEDSDDEYTEGEGTIYNRCSKSQGCFQPDKHLGKCRMEVDMSSFDRSNAKPRCLKRKNCPQSSGHAGSCFPSVETAKAVNL